MPSFEGLSYDPITQSLRTNANGFVASKTVTYTNSTNANGDFDGTGNPQNLFTVTGQVLVAVIGICSTSLAGASATIAVGNSTTAGRYLPQQTATNITAGKTWDITGLVSAGTAPNRTPNQAALNTENIIATVGTADISAGVITFYAYWIPLASGATLVAD